MTFQNRPCHPIEVQHFGCWFFSAAFLILRRFGNLSSFTDGWMDNAYADEAAMGRLGVECLVSDPQGLCNYLAHTSGKIIYKGFAVAGYKCLPNQMELQEWYNPYTEVHHFMAGDGFQGVDYDPWEGGSLTHKQGKCVGKRILEVVPLE